MNKLLSYFILFVNILFFTQTIAQEPVQNENSQLVPKIFLEDEPLPIKLSFAIKDVKKNTNDSTYIDTSLFYQLKDGTEHELEIKLRSRGNYRLKNCYFPPIKMKLKKKETKNTLFEGNKHLKLVMPCLLQKDNNDNIVKEYLAYKLFELISPYHFKTRLIEINFEEVKGQKIKNHNLKGILIEDDKNVAKRFDGKVYDRYSHPLNHEPLASVRSSLFEYMIGNTDYSQAYLHNMEVIFINNKMIPIPYDFDMSGFVNTSYAVVSEIQGESLGLKSVTERKYRGFVRDEKIFDKVRLEIIGKKEEMIMLLNSHENYFENPKEFEVAKDYILSFLAILMNDQKFKKEIVDSARDE